MKTKWKDLAAVGSLLLLLIGLLLIIVAAIITARVSVVPEAQLVQAEDVIIEQPEVIQETPALVAPHEEPKAQISSVPLIAAPSYWEPQYREPVYNYTEDEMRELRKGIESGGNYATDTGNGYLGAYQFSEQYMEGRYYNYGLDQTYGAYDRDAFLNSPEQQDAAADAYANDFYGGWQNTPTSGGW